MFDAETCKIVRQNMFWKIRLALIEIACKQINRKNSAPLQIKQHRQKTERILAARNSNQPFWPLAFARWRTLNHVEFFDSLAHLPHQTLAQLLEFN